jgi:DNA-binding response OmpR family regulator
MRLLLVEDEPDLADVIQTALTEAGYQVDVAADGAEGERYGRSRTYDIMVIDWMLPHQDGVSLIKALREAHVKTPMLMLTAVSGEEDVVTGLDAGADDYLTKPFSFSVLFARLRALTRRGDDAVSPPNLELCLGPLRVDRRAREVYWDDTEVVLRPKEYQLLERLACRPNTTVTRTELAESVWGSTFIADDTINTTVSGLRKKLQQLDTEPELSIRTRRGVGYQLVAPSGAASS